MHDSLPIPQPPAMTGIQDSQLLEAWVREQRQEDFTEIVRRHLGLVEGIARRQVDSHLAEDIAQQVFAILARKAPSLGEVRSLSAWLHRVTLLQCRSAIRRGIRDRKNQEAAMENLRIADARDPLADALPHMDAAIGALSESDRELILLRYSEGLSFSEAARQTGRKEAALRQQAGRALEKLSVLLRRRGVAVPAATLTTGLGVHLAGTSSASAAILVSNTALTSAGGIAGALLAGITFFTMTAKQSIAAGAVLATLLITGPLAWRASQIHHAEQSASAAARLPAAGSPDAKANKPGETATTSTAKTKSTRDRSAKPLTEVERMRMMMAIPGIFVANVKESMADWFARDAWMEARRMALGLGLSADKEKELRELLIAEHTKLVAGMDLEDKSDEDRIAQRREKDARVDAWFAANLSPHQQEERKRLDDARDAALTEKLANSAVATISANIDLNEEQKDRFYEAAAAKVSRTLEEKSYANSFGLGMNVFFTPPPPPVEESAGELVNRILEPAQRELWQAAIKRDHSFGESMQKRVIGSVFQQLEKIKPTQEEMFGSPGEN